MELIADCTLEIVHHCLFDPCCVRRRALYYRGQTSITVYHVSAHYIVERQFRGLLSTPTFFWMRHSLNWWHTSLLEEIVVSSFITVLLISSSCSLPVIRLSHPVVIALCCTIAGSHVLYRIPSPLCRDRFQLCYPVLYCVYQHYIALFCTMSVKRSFSFARHSHLMDNTHPVTPKDVHGAHTG